MIRRVLFFTLLASYIGCKSSHKLTGTDFVDLSTGIEAINSPQFPTEIVASLGWGDLSSDTLDDVREEFRISLTSEAEPYHLFRIYTTKKGVEGESVLFWRNKNPIDRLNTHENMRQYLKGKCEIFFETDNYGYCKPEYNIEPDWGKIYSNLEGRNIWQIPDQSQLELGSQPDTNLWVMNTQVRLSNYFRSYSQSSPEHYPDIPEKRDILAILIQLQVSANNEHRAENFNVYSGITNGERGSSFTLCDESEAWRFNASLEELIFASGYPAKIEGKEEQYFYITVSGIVEDEWYGNRGNSGFTRVIRPLEINSISTVTKKECPKE